MAYAPLSSRDLFPGPMALSVKYVVEVVPLGVAALDQPDLPGAGPFLERLFALNCVGNVVGDADIEGAVPRVESGGKPCGWRGCERRRALPRRNADGSREQVPGRRRGRGKGKLLIAECVEIIDPRRGSPVRGGL